MISFNKNKLFYLIAFFVLFFGFQNQAYASGNYCLELPIQKTEKKSEKKIKRKFFRKKRPEKKHASRDNALTAYILWNIFLPLSIAALISLSFIFPFLGWMWYAGLVFFGIWAGISGVVFFPVQYIGLPLGMALIILGLINGSLLFWTAGLAVVFAAMFAFSFMVLMFTIGTRKFQPK